jgi:hypothetical protein
MDKYLVIKMFKVRSKSKDVKSRVLVLTYNTSKVHGGYRFDRLGVIKYFKNSYYCYINLYKIGYWLNSGAYLKTKISWFIGIIGKYEIKSK